MSTTAILRLRPLFLVWLGTILLFSLSIFFDLGFLLRICLGGMLLASAMRREWRIFPAILVFAVIYFGPNLYPAFFWRIPTIPFLVPLVVTWIVCVLFHPLKAQLDWIHLGSLDSITRLLTLVTAIVAAAALLLWALWSENLGVGASMVKELQGIPRWFLFLVGVPIFALLNALFEECVYRGFLQNSLEKILPGRDWLVLALQASAFAAAHYAVGFPNGKIGYLMTFTYALMLGYLKKRSGGMLAPVIAHIAADLVIGYTLILLAT